ncbi:MAG: methylmalonyl Co-A mutase-associated GTPase MeaB [bacterium]
MKKSNNITKSALSEKDGILAPKSKDKSAINKIKKKRRSKKSTDSLIEGIFKGDIVDLSRGITLIESGNPQHITEARKIVKACLKNTTASIRIGITGVPGAGKSTFIEAYGNYLTSKGKKVAVLAVDPSSSVSKGSILGDKTRMETLVRNPNVFIRPSASGTNLGGVAQKTRETILLCEAAGFDTILIETVGVGQSETVVHSMVDFFLLLKIAGAGDELQGIKRGIIELADSIIINKADGENIKSAKLARVEFARALHFYPEMASGWHPKVLLTSALKNEGIKEVAELIQSFEAHTKKNGHFSGKRIQQNTNWFMQTIETRLRDEFMARPEIKSELEHQISLIEKGETTAFDAVEKLFSN